MSNDEKHRDDFTMKIVKIESSKHKIKQRALMNADVIPKHPCISVFSGSQGGGKSTLVNNLLTKPHFYGLSMEDTRNDDDTRQRKNMTPRGYFDAIFLLIGSDDDMYDKLIDDGTIDKDHVVHMPKSSDIQKIIDKQKSLIESEDGDITKVPKILCIFDDVVNDGKLIRSKAFLELFVKGRHLNSSTWFLSQYLNLIPKPCRLQANYLFVFKCNKAELQILYEQFCPVDMSKKNFYDMVQDVTADTEQDKNNFLMIVKRAPLEQRFRQNLDTFVVLQQYGDPEIDVKGILGDMKKKKKKSKSSSDEKKKKVKDVPLMPTRIKENTSVLPMLEKPKMNDDSKPKHNKFDRSTMMRINSLPIRKSK